MTWIKLDDNFPDNPKIRGLSNEAFRLYIELLCYCGRLLTDGYIKQIALDRLDADITHLELLDARLLDATDDGVYIRSYDEWQTLKADIDKSREQGRERQRRYNAKTNALMTESRIQNTDNRIQNTEIDFDAFWSVYPRKHGKQAAIRAWLTAIKKVEPQVIVEAAKRYADDPNRVDQFTAHASTWLNQGRWEDAPLPNRVSRAEISLDNRPTPIPPTYDREEALKSEARGVKMPSDVKDLINKIRYNGMPE
jgi:hypothetical protein